MLLNGFFFDMKSIKERLIESILFGGRIIALFLLTNSFMPPTFVQITGVFTNSASAIEYPNASKSRVSETINQSYL